MDEDATIDDDVMNKVFKSKIVINSEPGKYDPVSAGYDTLHDAILANEYQTTPEIAKTKIASKQAVDLSQTAPVIKWVEKAGESTIKKVTKPDSTSINIDSQTSELSINDTKIKIFRTKSLDRDSGKYSLSDYSYEDPTTLDFNGNVHYYYQTESIVYNQNTNKLFSSIGAYSDTIYEIISATKKDGTTVWNNVSYNSVTYNLSVITLTETELETDNSDKGIYQETDDYGTTYYYRGNVKNNNLYFANAYWKIIRINGDGSTRLLYNGLNQNSAGVDLSINSQKYSFNNNSNSPAYAGYMYGNINGKTFDEIHSNTNSSNIKNALDSWYKSEIVDNNYDKYITENPGFCGDRTIYGGGDGVQTDTNTNFGAYGRNSNHLAQFKCPNIERDLYTVPNSIIGNKSLTYPVGLITYDELIYAGMSGQKLNKLSWAYSEQNYWTMSPSYYRAVVNSALGFFQHTNGYMTAWNAINSMLTRPVINLKSDVKINGGTGTANDPYVVDTNS